MKLDTGKWRGRVGSAGVGSLPLMVCLLIAGCAISAAGQQGARVVGVDRAGGSNAGVGLIPNSRYRAHFGAEHTFHLGKAAYGQDRRFEYEGYSFGFVDEWPTNWLPKEDVFITQIDGAYFLCNRSYAGVTVPLRVAPNRDASVRPVQSSTSELRRDHLPTL